MSELIYKQFPAYLKALMQDFNKAAKEYAGSPVTILAESLMRGAILLDYRKGLTLPVHFKYTGIIRDVNCPPEFEASDILKADWADRKEKPLGDIEKWNEGRRATATGQRYRLDGMRRPLNPYIYAGINGRGVLGQFGPNHAVDNGMLVIKPDEQGKLALYALGILRKFDHDAPALAGGFVKYTDGKFSAPDYETIIQNQTDEFFEEVISGSIELMPEFANQIEQKFQEQMCVYTTPDADHTAEVREQVITALKMEQVKKCDPEFLERLKSHISSGRECFAGPVLNDPRNTNSAWIESRLSWAVFDDEAWETIKGDNKFKYELSGGDDASDIVFHKYSPETIEHAYASHGPMMCFMAASYLLSQQEAGLTVAPDIVRQLDAVSDYLTMQARKFPMECPYTGFNHE